LFVFFDFFAPLAFLSFLLKSALAISSSIEQFFKAFKVSASKVGSSSD